MAKVEYKLGQNTERKQAGIPGPPGPRMGGGGGEKAKNFTATWGKLLRYCKW